MLSSTDKIIQHKTGLLNLAEELGNVSKVCQVMGMSRDTFYRYKSAVEDGGVEALFERTRRKPNLANRVDQATEDTVIKSATDFPAYGQARRISTRQPGYARAGSRRVAWQQQACFAAPQAATQAGPAG